MDRSDDALSKVRALIARQNVALGGRIPPERTLASELGVGRRSVRRALDVLEQEGRIHRHQGLGTFIDTQSASAGAIMATPNAPTPGAVCRPSLSAALDHTNPLEVIEVRLATEPVMARLAAFRMFQSEIKLLQMLAAKTRAASDAETYERADFLFHRTIAEAARNSLFLAFFDTMRASQRDVGWQRLGENARCYKRRSVYADFHESIAVAIAARNGQEAYAQMHRHLDDVRQHIQNQAFPGADAVLRK